MRLLKSAEGVSPHIQLTEMGPSVDLTVRRMQSAPPDLMAEAMKQPAAMPSAPTKIKNVERSALHGRQGRLHMPRQDLRQLTTARMKGFRGSKRARAAGTDDTD